MELNIGSEERRNIYGGRWSKLLEGSSVWLLHCSTVICEAAKPRLLALSVEVVVVSCR